MARSRMTFNKKEREKKKQKRKEEKFQKKEDKKSNPESKSLDDMIAYVDEFGNITDTPPDPTQKKKEIKADHIEISVPRQEDEDPDQPQEGIVSYFDTAKNYGFITKQGTQDRFFVHGSNAIDPIQEGDKVTFIAQRGMKGMDAVEVKKASEEESSVKK